MHLCTHVVGGVCACFVCMPACCPGQGSVHKHVCNEGFVRYSCTYARMWLVMCVCFVCLSACCLGQGSVHKHVCNGGFVM